MNRHRKNGAPTAVGILPFISKPTRLASIIAAHVVAGMALHSAFAGAEDYFNPLMLEVNNAQGSVDLEHFSQQGGQLPGAYEVEIYLNENRIEKRSINFVMVEGKLQPELTPLQLKDMGVKVEAFESLKALPDAQAITDLSAHIANASTHFNFGKQRLEMSIPQAALTSEARGYVDPASWDHGLPAALLNYSFSGSNTARKNSDDVDDSYYLNLRSGLNLGAWRLRNYSAYSLNNGQSDWQNISSYLQRDIHSLKSELTLGDSSTPSGVFDSIAFRGAQLASDDNMYPDSLRGFAPVVRGIAKSNAQVTIRQNGYVIYQSYVPAGAFEITDLYPTASSGDMEVTITEADGSERTSVQAFSAVPIMLREGRLKYSLTAGQYRSSREDGAKPSFALGTLIYGLPFDTTLYGGVLASAKYQATTLGVGHGFGTLGSISMDVTQARTELGNGSKHAGQSYRFQYAKDIETTGTTFTLAGYRYSTSGYYDFQEANEVDPDNFGDWRRTYNKRSKVQLNMNQRLGDYGSVYLSAHQQDFWQQKGKERSVSAGYNTTHRGVNYGVNYTYSQASALSGRNGNDQQLSFSVQMPLGGSTSRNWARYNLNTSQQGNTTHQAGINGTALEDNTLSYGVEQSYAQQGVGASGNANLGYKGSQAEVRAGVNYNANSKQVNYGVQGGVVAHPYGVTFSQQQGETMALVRAPGAKGIKVESAHGVKTDSRGFAVVPYVSSYRANRVALDTRSLPDDVDMEGNTKMVVPTKGALVLADFQTRIGSRVLISLQHQGKPVPFGANATLVEELASSPNVGIIGQDGELYLAGAPESGTLQVQWGDKAGQSCKANFTLPPVAEDAFSTVRTISASCI